MYQSLRKFLFISFVNCCLFCTIQAQTQKSSVSSIEFGPATNAEGSVGISVGFAQFYKVCVFFDYLGILDKDGFIYHEFSPKLGLYATDEKTLNVSVSTGIAIASYTQRNNIAYNFNRLDETIPFVGIPLQARIDFSPRSRIGGGVKCAYIFSITEKRESHAALALFLSIRLHRDLKD